MATKISRKKAVIFGGSASAAPGGIAEFGSLEAGSIVYSTDPDVIQSLPAWSNGWGDAWVSNFPALEDENAIDYVNSRQIAYLLQEGVAEWNADTSYFIGSFCSLKAFGEQNSNLYVSLTDNNLGNDPTADNVNWQLYPGGAETFYAEGTGTDHVLATIPAGDGFPAAYENGIRFGTRVTVQFADNVSSGADINVNGIGAVQILDAMGQTILEGYILAGMWATGTLTDGEFRMDMICRPSIFYSGNDSGSVNQLTYTIPTFSVTGGGAPIVPTGTVINALIGNTNSGATVISINSNSNLDVKSRAGVALTGGELVAGSVYTLVYDGSAFRLMA